MSERIHHNSEREYPRRKRLIRALGYAGMAFSMVGIHAGINVAQNQERAANSEVQIDILAGPIDEANSDTAIVSIDGFNELDAENVSNSIGVGVQQPTDGQLWSVNYNNSLFDERAIAEAIAVEASQQGVDRIVINGYSAGGNIGFDVYHELQQSMTVEPQADGGGTQPIVTQLEMPLVVASAMPSGMDRVQSHYQEQIEFLDFIATNMPDLLYYDPARFIGELFHRRDVMPRDPIGTIAYSWDYVFNDKATPAWLLELQLRAVAESDLEGTLNDIGEYAAENDLPQPVIVYQTTVDGNEYMIDDVSSARDLRTYAEQNDMPYFVNPIQGAVHTRPDISAEVYTSTLAALAPQIQQAIADQIEEPPVGNGGAGRHFLVN